MFIIHIVIYHKWPISSDTLLVLVLWNCENFITIFIIEYGFNVCFWSYCVVNGSIQVMVDARKQKWFAHWFFMYGLLCQQQCSLLSAVLKVEFIILYLLSLISHLFNLHCMYHVLKIGCTATWDNSWPTLS